MRTFSMVKGLPVIDAGSGEKLGEVSDLNVSGDGKFLGLLLKRGSLLRRTYLVPAASILACGEDGVMVDGADCLELLQARPEFTMEHEGRLSGRMMISREGQELGLLNDVYFSEELGTIVGYELTDGFFSDLMEGKRVVNPVAPPAIGKDAIVVNVENEC
ncbi:PRC-barrel domain-containing protein [Bacillus sp. FJAT-27251]|uniref:PRC-barrel domain-containing protein n=1 Tax=Bacillus sp. FJAT-27251 TaxID=1684142 RepID=UPI0006A7B41F|nr:PRC-barrel domain-containing protein [Bacillus sp. FJAT-27251]